MAEFDDSQSLKLQVDTPGLLPFETLEALIAGARATVEIATLAAVPVEVDDGRETGLFWSIGVTGDFISYRRRGRRPSDLEATVSHVHYGSPLEIVAGVVGVGWVVVQASAMIARLLTTQLAERRQLVSEANRNNADADKLQQEARLMRLQGDRIALENAERVERLADQARRRAVDSLQGVRTEVAQTILDSEGVEAAERFLRATDDAIALGRAAALAEFDTTVEIEGNQNG